MNRLTKRNSNGVAYMSIAETLAKWEQEIEGSQAILEGVYAIFQKLAAYEDTGLEPEDILSNIKFLSNELNNALEKLAEYEQLEEQGLLIKLPCKVGDTVYVNAKTFGTHDDIEYAEAEVVSIRITKKQTFLKLRIFALGLDGMPYGCTNYPVASFGKTVFAIREEAEKALEEENV